MTDHVRMALDAAINPYCILDLATPAFVTVTDEHKGTPPSSPCYSRRTHGFIQGPASDMPALANLPVEIWERIIYDVVGTANPIPKSEFPWVSGLRSDTSSRAARKQRLHKLQSLSAVARTWRELCLTLSYETFQL